MRKRREQAAISCSSMEFWRCGTETTMVIFFLRKWNGTKNSQHMGTSIRIQAQQTGLARPRQPSETVRNKSSSARTLENTSCTEGQSHYLRDPISTQSHQDPRQGSPIGHGTVPWHLGANNFTGSTFRGISGFMSPRAEDPFPHAVTSILTRAPNRLSQTQQTPLIHLAVRMPIVTRACFPSVTWWLETLDNH